MIACLKFAFLSLVLTMWLTGCNNSGSSEKSEYTFKLGHLANEDHVWHQAALHFARIVQQRSEGKVTIKVYPNEQLGKELDMVTGILAGTVDMTITGESLQNWAPEAALCAIPYMINDQAHLKAVAGGNVGQKIAQKITSEVGLRPLTWLERGARHLTADRPIYDPSDLNGIILRVPNVPLFIDTWSSLGAKPTPMAFSEVFTALQQGTIEAQENPLSLIKSAGFYEVQDYVNLTEHVIGWVYLVMGEKQFQTLPPELQEIIISAGSEMQVYHDEQFGRQQEQLKKELQELGMQFIETDKKAFQSRARQAVWNNLGPEQKPLYEEATELIKNF